MKTCSAITELLIVFKGKLRHSHVKTCNNSRNFEDLFFCGLQIRNFRYRRMSVFKKRISKGCTEKDEC